MQHHEDAKIDYSLDNLLNTVYLSSTPSRYNTQSATIQAPATATPRSKQNLRELHLSQSSELQYKALKRQYESWVRECKKTAFC